MYGTVFAIDLRDLDWDRKYGERYDMWTVMLSQYGYGLRFDEVDDDELRRVDRDLYDMGGRTLVHMRADWFIAVAIRPPLYHTVLRLPQTAGELEKKLGVDVATNFKRNRLWRAGYTRSGVSKQHRMIERHDSLYGAYWKSYDFKQEGDRNNLMRFPLGPDFSYAYKGLYPFRDAAFKQDGGEMIFNLPNGLQAYYLVNGKDERINSGPTDVVYDEKHVSGTPDIVSGLSCMACHNKGMIWGKERKDAVRYGTSVDGDLKVKVRRLYPSPEKMDEYFKKDEVQFLTAELEAVGPFLAPAGLLPKGKELPTLAGMKDPIGDWAGDYRRKNMNLVDVAYELGYDKPDEFKGALGGNSNLRDLGLKVLLAGDELKRPEWEGTELLTGKAGVLIRRLKERSLYQKVMHELGLGRPVNITLSE